MCVPTRTTGHGPLRAEAAAFALLALMASGTAFAEQRTAHVILLTLDGVRTQERFGGLDQTIAAHADTQSCNEMAGCGHAARRRLPPSGARS
jgi:hypothetical protein